jgi:hypothetical protein
VASREEMPIWNIKSIAGETDELIKSMCYGMYQRGKTKANMPDGEDILEYNGKGNRNQQVNCKKFCVGRFVSILGDLPSETSSANQLSLPDITKERGIKMECDEYPPAVLNQGPQTRVCIPAYQNSGTQGPMLGSLRNRCDLQKGDKVKVKIDGGCKGFKFEKREAEGTLDHAFLHRRADATVSLTGSNATLRNPMGDGSLLYISLETDELADGHYDFSVAYAGTIQNVTVMNAYGEEYAT